VRRAAELADSDPERAASERPLTRVEIERAASELGLPASAVSRAFEGGEAPQEKSGITGGRLRIVYETEVDGEPSELDREDIIEEIRSAIGETGAIESVGKTLVWRLESPRGRELSVRVRSRSGKTRIVVEERLRRQAIGLFVGMGVGGGIGPLGLYILMIAFHGAIAALIPILWIPIMLVSARLIFGALADRRSRQLQDLSQRLTRQASQWSAPVPTRVASEEKENEEEEIPADVAARKA